MKKRVLLILTLLIFSLIGCSQFPMEPRSQVLHDIYTIAINSLHPDSIFFSYTTYGNRFFITPLHYFDNPTEEIEGALIRDLSVTDANGFNVDTTCIFERIGPLTNRIIILPEKTVSPVTINYRLDLSSIRHDPEVKMMPEVHIHDSSLFLIGAYCFIVPKISGQITRLWRTYHSVRVNITAPAEMKIYGIPSCSFTCENIYQLLFLQLSANSRILAKGHGGGTDFIFLDYLNKTYRPGLFDSLSIVFSSILDDIASRYGSFSGMPYTVGIHDIWGGLEGSFGFAIGEPLEGEDSRFGEILAHEALHHFIGIRCGEYDDQWWKESAATWLGLECAVRLGFYPKECFRQRMTSRFAWADTARFRISLSSEHLRLRMFVDTLYMLVYDRGAQVMMLLDVRIRMGSGNRSTLNDVMADLCRRFSGNAFTRTDFISTLELYGASDASEIFSALVDSPDSVMSEKELIETFSLLDSLENAW